MKAEYSSKLARAVLGLGLVGLLAGCSNGPSWGAWSKRPSDAHVAAVLARVDAQEQVAQQQQATPRQTPSIAVASTDR
jgi:hypothetical protein